MAWRQVTSTRVRHVEFSDEVLRDKRRERRLLDEQLDRLAKLEENALRSIDLERKKLANERLLLLPTRSRPVSIGDAPHAIGVAAARGEGGRERVATTGAYGGAAGEGVALARVRRISCPPRPTACGLLTDANNGVGQRPSSKESLLSSSGSR